MVAASHLAEAESEPLDETAIAVGAAIVVRLTAGDTALLLAKGVIRAGERGFAGPGIGWALLLGLPFDLLLFPALGFSTVV